MTAPRIAFALAAAACLSAAPVPTFSKDIAPILHKNCAGCHRPKDIAPMSLLEYKSARPWAKAIRDSVLSGKMPPWFADPRHGQFANDARLSPADRDAIKQWADNGAPEGDPKNMPTPPKFVEGWHLGKPEVVVDIGEDFKVTPGNDAYEHFFVDTHFKEGFWIRAAEIKPGNREVVHHVHVNLIESGEAGATTIQGMKALKDFMIVDGKLTRLSMDAPVVNDACASAPANLPYLTGFQEGALASFLPGRQPDAFPEGSAKWVPAGARLEFVVHYARVAGPPRTDRTSVGFYLAPGPPKKVMRRMDLRNFFFEIPPNESNHEVKRCYTFEKGKMLLSFTPHFHYRGKDVVYELTRPDGRKEILLSIPKYDFEWQLVYRLKEPVFVEKGSVLKVVVHYDNSPNNKANPDPSRRIRWGDKSEEEMMTSWIEYLDADPPARPSSDSSGN